MVTGPITLANANRVGALASVTLETADHFLSPWALAPLNFTPLAGPLASTHSPPVASGLHSPIRGRSLTIAYTVSGLASIRVDADTVGLFAIRVPPPRSP